jgi:2-methylisocitrate lyase-like PEP mutase family enzyme
MPTQNQKAEQFRQLHVPGRPWVLFNIWDPGSAKAVAAAGARALGTGSWSVANASGYADGEKVPLPLVLDNLRRIAAHVELPVSIDLESGYGQSAGDVGAVIARSIEAGAIGCNIEDSFPETGKLRDVAAQVERIRAARHAAEQLGLAYFINARSDVFFQGPASEHGESWLADAIVRARAYADAGADGFFAPGLIDETLIAKLAAASSLPLNIMVGSGTPALDRLAQAGVARVSHGPGPYLAAMRSLEAAAKAALAGA